MSACAEFVTEVTSASSTSSGVGVALFFVGFIIALIPCFICFWIFCCYRRFKKRSFNMMCLDKLHCEQAEVRCFEQFGRLKCMEDPKDETLAEKEKTEETGTGTSPPPSDDEAPTSRSRRQGSGRHSSRRSGRRIGFLDPANILVELKLLEAGANFTPGRDELALIDAITQTTEGEGELELARQELRSAQLEQLQLWRNRLIGLTGLCGALLNSLLSQRLIDDRKRDELRERQTDRLKKAKEMLDAEFKTRRDAVADNKSLTTEEKQVATDAIDAEYGPRLGEQLQEEMTAFEKDIRKQDGMDPKEADRLLAELREGQARLEKKIADQQRRAADQLAEKQALRRRRLAEQKAADSEVAYDLEPRLAARRKQLDELVADKRLGESQAQQAMANYRRELLKQKEAFEKSYLSQREALHQRLLEARRKKLTEADAEAAQPQRSLAAKVDTGSITDPDSFLDEFERALAETSRFKNEATTELDDSECRQLDQLRRDLAKTKDDEEAKVDEAAIKQLGLAATDEELQRMLADHRHQTDRFRREKRAERKRQAMRLEEKLSERQARLAAAKEAEEAELNSVKRNQEVVLRKALVYQVDLDENTRRQILEEHDRNMQAVTNNLHLSRHKQEASLEAKLAQRRAEADRLKKEAHDARLAIDDERRGDLDKLDAELNRKLDENKKQLELERRNGLAQIRDEMARETESALRAQETHMSAVIGRLQTGRARRHAAITEQEKVLKELEIQLQDGLKGRLRSGDVQGLDQVLQSYNNQVAAMERQLDHERRHQDRQLTEELQRRKLDRRDRVQEEVDKEEDKSIKALKASGHGRMAKFVMDSVLDTKYRNSMLEINEEMRMELRKEQELLDREMEDELKAELDKQREHLFGQLTALTDLSPDEVKEMVDKAAKSAGAGKRLTRKMTNEFVSIVQESRNSFKSQQKRSGSSRQNSRGRYDDGDFD
ncbi:hypothetical protein BOX15_Mlig021650g3 [Macrostomum lignano]|uniref:CARD domain-containing protein n=1 Tax=Macrostomum lignano TaxID=282301 RepID=A0A267G8F1_9PLAT|nr:hypothetical protein BOX15_Mlig021650g3 [Macrostomum lignano]